MVVSDFLIIHYPYNIGVTHIPLADSRVVTQPCDQALRRIAHILSQIATVCSRIGRELLFIKRLEIVERLLRREAENTVTLALQGRQIIKLRRLLVLFLYLDLLNCRGSSVTSAPDLIRLIFCFCSFAARRKTAAGDLRNIKQHALETVDLSFTLNKQRKRRGHHAPNIELGAVQHGKQPRCVDTDDPICLSTAKRRLIEHIIIAAGTELSKTFSDRFIFHTRDPQSFDGLVALRVIIHEPEYQFSLTARVGRANDTIDLSHFHQVGKNIQLFLFILCNAVHPLIGNDRQRIIRPTPQLFVIHFGIGKSQKVPEAPAHQITTALHISFMPLCRAQHLRNRERNRRLFRYY